MPDADVAEKVRGLAVELTRVHATLLPSTTPEAVFDHLADAHAALIAALATIRAHRAKMTAEETR